ncbi:hypothetical protein WJX72_009891 [[Myrmecia] bisecta]|uniref:tRNA(Ile)-lysidine synthetase n=1 Tax=[Myrmecia] bisecta TaxID=41462 RepID=A0AAW1QSD9_9CHLO
MLSISLLPQLPCSLRCNLRKAFKKIAPGHLQRRSARSFSASGSSRGSPGKALHPSDWAPLHYQVQKSVRQRKLLPHDANILVAVSGGQDSLCLAKLLLDMQMAGQAGSTHVITGHTASDRAETLLFNLMRGSGIDGLQALTWQRGLSPGLQLVRPLLEVSREQTGRFCAACALEPWVDSTNTDMQYKRNRIRQELLPYLRDHFNPKVDEALSRTADILQADVELLEQQAAALLSHARQPDGAGIDRDVLKAAPLALRRRAVRQWLREAMHGQCKLAFVDKALCLLDAPNRTVSDSLGGNLVAVVDKPYIVLRPC